MKKLLWFISLVIGSLAVMTISVAALATAYTGIIITISSPFILITYIIGTFIN